MPRAPIISSHNINMFMADHDYDIIDEEQSKAAAAKALRRGHLSKAERRAIKRLAKSARDFPDRLRSAYNPATEKRRAELVRSEIVVADRGVNALVSIITPHNGLEADVGAQAWSKPSHANQDTAIIDVRKLYESDGTRPGSARPAFDEFLDGKRADKQAVKVYLRAFVDRNLNGTTKGYGCWYTTAVHSMLPSADVRGFVQGVLDELQERVEQTSDSTYLVSIKCLEMVSADVFFTTGGTYRPTPAWLAKNKNIRNVQNDDVYCWDLAILSVLLRDVITRNPQRASQYKPYLKDINREGIEYPFEPTPANIARYEANNALSVNVYVVDEENQRLVPFHLTTNTDPAARHVDVLLLEDEGEPVQASGQGAGGPARMQASGHFAGLLSVLFIYKPGNRNAYVRCVHCDSFFWSADEFERHRNMGGCASGRAQVHYDMPSEGATYKFKNWTHLNRVPIFAVLDFEAVCRPIRKSSVLRDQDLAPDAFAKTMYTQVQTPGAARLTVYDNDLTVIKHFVHHGEDCVQRLFEHLQAWQGELTALFVQNTPMSLTPEQERAFKAAERCYVCERRFDGSVQKVRDHDHFSGGYAGAACSHPCNVKKSIHDPNGRARGMKVPIFVHNFKGYDAKFVMQELARHCEGEPTIDVIMINPEKPLMLVYGPYRFVDSYAILGEGLEALAELLDRTAANLTPEMVARYLTDHGSVVSPGLALAPPAEKQAADRYVKAALGLADVNWPARCVYEPHRRYPVDGWFPAALVQRAFPEHPVFLEADAASELSMRHIKRVTGIRTTTDLFEALGVVSADVQLELLYKYEKRATIAALRREYALNDFQLVLLLQKGTFPYSHWDDMARLAETEPPARAAFRNELRHDQITDAGYGHVLDVWHECRCRTFGDYMDLYLAADVTLLADILTVFRRTFISRFKLDIAWYLTLGSYSKDAFLLLTGAEFELLSDPDMLRFVQRAIVGGVSTVMCRHAVANNKYLGEAYDPARPTSFIVPLDANQLYPSVMSEKMPVRDFRWTDAAPYNEDPSRLHELYADPDVGHFVEVDLDYPERLHDAHSDYPLCPEQLRITEDMLGPVQHAWIAKGVEGARCGSIKKLVPNLYDKRRVVMHHLNLLFYLEQGLELRRVHAILTFHQAALMKPYIDRNIEFRKQATTEFEAKVAKDMNNILYGKMIENPFKQCTYKIAVTDAQRLRYQSSYRYKGLMTFDNGLTIYEMTKRSVRVDTPVYVGVGVLQLSKLAMYKFHYGYIRPTYGDRAQLLLTDTDSLYYHIAQAPGTPFDMFLDMIRDKHEYDLSNFDPSLGIADEDGQEHQLYDPTNKRALLKFKYDVGSAVIERFSGNRAKSYAFTKRSMVRPGPATEKKTLKGINRGEVQARLRYSMYEATVLKGLVVADVPNVSIVSERHQLVVKTVYKNALTPFDDKRYILPDGVHTRALGHHLDRAPGNTSAA